MFDLLPPFAQAACLDHGAMTPWAGQALVPAPDTPTLAQWRGHHGAGAGAMTRMPDGAPFEPALIERLCRAIGAVADRRVTLIYVATCHQPHYRSPVLPHLLGALPEFAAVHALRDGSGALPEIALTLADAVLAGGAACLLIHDLSRRLIPQDAPDRGAGCVRFTLFTPISAEGAAA